MEGGDAAPPPCVGVDGVEARKETPQERYPKAHTININIRLRKNTDPHILEKLGSVPNNAGEIKKLIRADIAKEK